MYDIEKVLLAVDGTESSRKAVSYVARFAPLVSNMSVCLLHVYPEPPPNFYVAGGNLQTYKSQKEKRTAIYINSYLDILHEAGVSDDSIITIIKMCKNKTISQAVLTLQQEGGYDTVVAGKRGVSKAEEFIFGSISNTIARECHDFTTWIVG